MAFLVLRALTLLGRLWSLLMIGISLHIHGWCIVVEGLRVERVQQSLQQYSTYFVTIMERKETQIDNKKELANKSGINSFFWLI